MVYLVQFIHNRTVLAAISSWAAAQVIKIIIELITERRFVLERITSSGGMPSSHSSFVVSLATMMGLENGFDSPLFALSFAFAMVVMYDAAGVRRAAGNQAKILNLIIKNIEITGLKIDEKLKELLGHTPIQVFMGALLGMAMGIVFYNFA